MSETNLPTVQAAREVAARALDRGDAVAANIAYSQELQLLASDAGKVAVAKQAPATEPIDHLFNMGLTTEAQGKPLYGLLEECPDLVTCYYLIGNAVKKMEETGSTFQIDTPITQEKIDKFLEVFTAEDARSLVASVQDFPKALTIAGRFLKLIEAKGGNIEADIFDEPELWRFVLPLMERIDERLNRPSPKSVLTPAAAKAGNDRDAFLETMAAFETRIAEFQSRGMNRDANRVYQEQMAWLASRNNADNRIVGSAGRTS